MVQQLFGMFRKRRSISTDNKTTRTRRTLNLTEPGSGVTTFRMGRGKSFHKERIQQQWFDYNQEKS